MSKQDAITAEHVRSILHYDPETGEFCWKERRHNAQFVGRIAGGINKLGYRQIHIDGKLYLAHRLAWLWITGSWPKEQIDHIDLDRENNCFSNLREATNAQNNRNRPASSNNTSGVKGVSWDRQRQKWRVYINVDGRRFYLSQFDKIEDAAASYAKAASELHGEFARIE